VRCRPLENAVARYNRHEMMTSVPTRRRIVRQFAVGAPYAISLASSVSAGTQKATSMVEPRRLPEGQIQPQAAIDDQGAAHLIYFAGDPKNGDVFYVYGSGHSTGFSKPIRVNSQAGSAIAAGTIRGAQLAIGRRRRVHVAWNGSSAAQPRGSVNPELGGTNSEGRVASASVTASHLKPHSHQSGSPMLYTRLDDSARGFEPQRNLMRATYGLDGGGSIAADRRGNVIVGWHGKGRNAGTGEAGRQVWISHSSNDGESFDQERPAWAEPTGACACCGMRLFADEKGRIHALYRSARENVHRDMYLLTSDSPTTSFSGRLLHRWEINACPMSSASFTQVGGGVYAAWETGGQIYWGSVRRPGATEVFPASLPGSKSKHPVLAGNRRGEILIAWTQGTGWQRGGDLVWRLFDHQGRPLTAVQVLPGIPAWSFPAAWARSDQNFTILY
jgi:hypothetical protein